MSDCLNDPTAPQLRPAAHERRHGERRRQVLRALALGSFHARRRRPRRASEQALAAVDWHHPQWLATAILILVFSSADAGLTLELMRLGAYEVNPLMRPLVGGSAVAFTLVKVGLTAGGVILLTLLAGMRAFGRLSAGFLLYALLAGYGALLVYEFRLLDRLL
ncbi:MAG: DUF5658 family protein [Steroidobacteraceae bacterium]